MDAATARSSRTTVAGHSVSNDDAKTDFDDSHADDIREPFSPMDSRGESSRCIEESLKRPRGVEEIHRTLMKSLEMLRDALVDAAGALANRKTRETDSAN